MIHQIAPGEDYVRRGPRCPVCHGWTDPMIREHPTCDEKNSRRKKTDGSF